MKKKKPINFALLSDRLRLNGVHASQCSEALCILPCYEGLPFRAQHRTPPDGRGSEFDVLVPQHPVINCPFLLRTTVAPLRYPFDPAVPSAKCGIACVSTLDRGDREAGGVRYRLLLFIAGFVDEVLLLISFFVVVVRSV